jgi:hypothetical protein
MSDVQWRWTAKFWLAIIGVVFAVLGFCLSTRGGRWTVIGAAFIFAGLAALIWSSTLHTWCAPANVKWGANFGQLLWHAPSFWDCVYLVHRG